MMAHVPGPAAARVAAPRTVRVRAALGLARVALVAGQAGAGAVNLEKDEIVVELQDIRPFSPLLHLATKSSVLAGALLVTGGAPGAVRASFLDGAEWPSEALSTGADIDKGDTAGCVDGDTLSQVQVKGAEQRPWPHPPLHLATHSSSPPAWITWVQPWATLTRRCIFN